TEAQYGAYIDPCEAARLWIGCRWRVGVRRWIDWPRAGNEPRPGIDCTESIGIHYASRLLCPDVAHVVCRPVWVVHKQGIARRFCSRGPLPRRPGRPRVP